MENMQGDWILYVALLTSNFLNADEQRENTDERKYCQINPVYIF